MAAQIRGGKERGREASACSAPHGKRTYIIGRNRRIAGGKEAFVKEFFSAVRHGAAAAAPDEVSELGDAGAGRVRVRHVWQPDGAQASGHEQQDGDPEHKRVYRGRRPAGAGRAGHLSAVHGVHGADDGHQRQKLSDLRSVQRAHEQRHRRVYRGHRGHQGVWPRGRVL